MAIDFKATPVTISEENRLINETIESLELPEHVSGYSIQFDQEPSGDPAVWINFIVEGDDGKAFPKSEISALTKFTNKVRVLLLEKHIQSWPYVRLLLV
jgi:hypothetical protein